MIVGDRKCSSGGWNRRQASKQIYAGCALLFAHLRRDIIADNKYSSLDAVCHFPLNMLIKKPELLIEDICKSGKQMGNKMRNLYVSDLDGTLLRSDETLSQFTIDTINELTSKGMLFSYATARSFVTAKKVTKGLNTHFPVIVYNGAFIIDNVTEEILAAHYFENEIADVFEELFENNIFPIVYSYIDGVEKFSFIPEKCTAGMRKFLQSRIGDKRTDIVSTPKELTKGNNFYITCIDAPEKLEPFYKKYKDKYHVVYERDIYTKEQWLEIMPKKASKSNAAKELKEMLKCEKLVAFGDGKNDIDMFEMSDEAYAVENADSELKSIATRIITSNNNDGVAKWLKENVMAELVKKA